jgi:hypothetical protein
MSCDEETVLESFLSKIGLRTTFISEHFKVCCRMRGGSGGIQLRPSTLPEQGCNRVLLLALPRHSMSPF